MVRCMGSSEGIWLDFSINTESPLNVAESFFHGYITLILWIWIDVKVDF